MDIFYASILVSSSCMQIGLVIQVAWIYVTILEQNSDSR